MSFSLEIDNCPKEIADAECTFQKTFLIELIGDSWLQNDDSAVLWLWRIMKDLLKPFHHEINSLFLFSDIFVPCFSLLFCYDLI